MQNSIIKGLLPDVAWHYEKIKVMEPQTIHHEILLLTDSTFTNREFCSRDEENQNGKKLLPMEELEKACWDGLLKELLPECFNSTSRASHNFLWNIVSGGHFLCINMGPCEATIERQASLDPYRFLSSILTN